MTPERAREMAEFVHDYIENLDNPSAESMEEIIGTLAEAILAADKPVEGAVKVRLRVELRSTDDGYDGCIDVVDGIDFTYGSLSSKTHDSIVEAFIAPVSVPVVEGRVVG